MTSLEMESYLVAEGDPFLIGITQHFVASRQGVSLYADLAEALAGYAAQCAADAASATTWPAAYIAADLARHAAGRAYSVADSAGSLARSSHVRYTNARADAYAEVMGSEARDAASKAARAATWARAAEVSAQTAEVYARLPR